MSEFTPYAWLIARFLSRWPLRYTFLAILAIGILLALIVPPLVRL